LIITACPAFQHSTIASRLVALSSPDQPMLMRLLLVMADLLPLTIASSFRPIPIADFFAKQTVFSMS
jgi:hypothetical protein